MAPIPTEFCAPQRKSLSATSGLYVEGQRLSQNVQRVGSLMPQDEFWEGTMKLPRRQFLHLAAGAAALPAVSRVAMAQAYPTRPVRVLVHPSGIEGLIILARGPRYSARGFPA